MSPKSKGRPKGRGRNLQRHAPVRQITAVDRILREARQLESVGRLQAQVMASVWLGEAWAERGPGDRDAEAKLVHDLIGVARRGRKPRAYLALHAMATVSAEAWADELAEVLGQTPPEVAPAWATDPRTATPEQPTRAQRWSDPWGSEYVYLLRYDDPAEHSVLAHVTTVGGHYVQYVEIGTQEEEPDAEVAGLTVEEIAPAEALAALAEALYRTDMYWPPQDSPDYCETRALAHWRTRGHLAIPEREPISDDDRRRLIDDFAAQHALDLDQDVLEVLADTFVDFGDGYLTGGVLAWSPDEVELFMLDWVPRKVLLDEECIVALPTVLREWVTFALRRRGLDEEHIAPVAECVDEHADAFLAAEADSADRGPAHEIMSRLVAEGVDPNDRDAVARIVSGYNAEQLARRMMES